jgi:hypothetical protein
MDESLLRRPGAPELLDTSELSALADEFERVGDLVQALRAQRLHTPAP